MNIRYMGAFKISLFSNNVCLKRKLKQNENFLTLTEAHPVKSRR